MIFFEVYIYISEILLYVLTMNQNRITRHTLTQTNSLVPKS